MNWSFRTHHRHSEANASELDSCDTVDPLLSLYADHMVSPEELRRVESHLPTCESCRESLDWMQATRRALSSRPIMLPPADLRSRIAGAIAASNEAPVLRPARAFSLRTAYAAAASVAVLGALILGHSLLTAPKAALLVPTAPIPAPRQVAALPKTESPQPTIVSLPASPKLAVKHSALSPSNPRVRSMDQVAAAAVLDRADTPLRETVVIKSPKQTKTIARTAPALTAAKIKTKVPSVLVAKLPSVKPTERTHRVLPLVEKRTAPLEASKPPAVSVGPTVITPQEVRHPMEASAPTGEAHVQTVSLLSSVQEYTMQHSSKMEHNLTRVGNTAIRHAVSTSSLTGQENGAAPVAGIYSP